MDIQETENKGRRFPREGGHSTGGGEKESTSDRAKEGWLCWPLSPPACVEGTEAVYAEEPRFPRGSGGLPGAAT